MEFLKNVKLKAGVAFREWKEKRADKKAAKEAHHPAGAAPVLWVWFLSTIAVVTLFGSSWLLAVFVAGSVGHVDWALDWRAGNDGQPARWIWFAEANIHALIGVGLAAACLGVGLFNAVWLHVREHIRSVLFRRAMTAIGIAVALFMISGAIVTQQWGTDARTRDQVAAVGEAQAGVAAIDAEIAAIGQDMERLCAPNLTTWQAQACRSGEAAWTDRINIARQQRADNFDIIERALADARQGDRWRARLTELRATRATASVTTVQAEVADVRATGWFATFTQVLEDIRKPFIAVLGELLAMTMFGVALDAHRSRQPYRVHPKESGWAPESLQIEDLTDEEAVKPKPMKPAREVVTDAETGEELIKITPKPHWRKQKGKKQRVETTPEPLPDETGFQDTARSGVTLGGVMELPESADAEPTPEASGAAPEAGFVDERVHEGKPDDTEQEADQSAVLERTFEQTDLSDDEAALALQELELTNEEPASLDAIDSITATNTVAEDIASDAEQAEPDQDSEHQETSDREEPETNPARMIAAE